jgi:hypothetical protein
MCDLAPLIEKRWIRPLVATLAGKGEKLDPNGLEADGLRFLHRWLDEPEIDLTTFPGDVRLAAMLSLAAIHIPLLKDKRLLPSKLAAVGTEAAAHEWVGRVSLEQLIIVEMRRAIAMLGGTTTPPNPAEARQALQAVGADVDLRSIVDSWQATLDDEGS